MEKLGLTENRVLIGLRKVTATRQLNADRPSTQTQATKPRKYR